MRYRPASVHTHQKGLAMISSSLVQNLRQQLMLRLPFSGMAIEDVDLFIVDLNSQIDSIVYDSDIPANKSGGVIENIFELDNMMTDTTDLMYNFIHSSISSTHSTRNTHNTYSTTIKSHTDSKQNNKTQQNTNFSEYDSNVSIVKTCIELANLVNTT